MSDMKRRPARRFVQATTLLAVAAMGLTACGSKDSDAGSPPSATPSASTAASSAPSKPAKAIKSLDELKVDAKQGKESTVTGAWPLKIDKTQSTVLKKGSGAKVKADSTVTFDYVGVNARDGKVFDSSYKRGQAVTFPLQQVVPGFSKGLAGHHVGDQVLIMMPGSDGYDSGGGRPGAGIQKGDSLIFVVEIKELTPTEATGEKVDPPAGLPTVSMAKDGPKVNIGKASKPSKLVTQPLIKGKGNRITANDVVTVKYRSWAWSTGKVVDDGYDDPGIQGMLQQTIPAWQEGLAGQTAGSRLLIIAPPNKAYPEGSPDKKVKKGETMTYSCPSSTRSGVIRATSSGDFPSGTSRGWTFLVTVVVGRFGGGSPRGCRPVTPPAQPARRLRITVRPRVHRTWGFPLWWGVA